MNYLITALFTGLVAFAATRAATDAEWQKVSGLSGTRKHPFARLSLDAGGADSRLTVSGENDV